MVQKIKFTLKFYVLKISFANGTINDMVHDVAHKNVDVISPFLVRENLLKGVQEDVASCSVFLTLSVQFNNAASYKMTQENNLADYGMFISFTECFSVYRYSRSPIYIPSVFSPVFFLISGLLRLQVFVDL
jgi:hypothetical protein